MNRFTSTLIFVFAGAITVCGLLVALTSAGASLANGISSAASSTALMTSQCISAFMVLVAIVAGVGVGIGYVSLRTARQQRQLPPYYPSPMHIGQPTFPPALQHLALPTPQDDADDELTEALIGLLKG